MKKILITCLMIAPIVSTGAEYDTFYKGRYTWGAEVNVFQSCGSKKAYWVSASSWVQGPLLEFYKSSVTNPYQPVYMEFRGHMLDEEIDGFAEDYDGLVRVSEIKRKTFGIPKECK